MGSSPSSPAKYCPRCEEYKPSSEFNRKGTRLSSYCSSCNKEYLREHYRDNKEYYKDKNARRKESLRRRVEAAKQVPCADCGNSYPPVCMDFDHVSDDKEESIANMIKNRASWTRIKEEMEKCEVVCANCHRIRTKDRYSGVV